ncbi:hypothetical protein [Novosphingobium sp. GV027]|uniref:hypothetical protein n=1 Tax=Novosphingobium sp. GV027 TaxID=2135689 RepID=UPI00105BFCE2|nr:hypothetical protein [Novosphingobium sp. GV027]
MRAKLARLVLALAVQSLGTRHRPWAQAMCAEFALAQADGTALRFSSGCLLAAWRMLPHHSEGRFALASYALCLGLLLPMGALLAVAALSGFPFVDASAGWAGFLLGQGTFTSQLNVGTQCLAPLLMALTIMLAAAHVPLAWWVLDHDWPRIAALSRLGAAGMVTLLLGLACAAVSVAKLAQPCAAMALECAAVSALALWHAQGFGDGMA